jgi:predicted nucleic-acid-binding Zn-ribbon protein
MCYACAQDRPPNVLLMRNSKKCPKCQSSDIVRIPGKRADGGAGNLISVSQWNIFSTVKPVRYLCAGCGYMEEWLDDPEDIARVKAAYDA